jgi:hypothetical protein
MRNVFVMDRVSYPKWYRDNSPFLTESRELDSLRLVGETPPAKPTGARVRWDQ